MTVQLSKDEYFYIFGTPFIENGKNRFSPVFRKLDNNTASILALKVKDDVNKYFTKNTNNQYELKKVKFDDLKYIINLNKEKENIDIKIEFLDIKP